jgi:hypothetical protein
MQKHLILRIAKLLVLTGHNAHKGGNVKQAMNVDTVELFRPKPGLPDGLFLNQKSKLG